MSSKSTYKKPVAVVGAGSFGTAVANILAKNTEVILFTRKPESAKEIAESRTSAGQSLHDRITPSNDPEVVGKECDIIFPVVPSPFFRDMIRKLSPYLRPYHILIHGTKGINVAEDRKEDSKLSTNDLYTMSRIIKEESLVVRIGCLAGPNLSKELADSQPAATVVASHFDEVIHEGQRLLRNEAFQVYGSKELLGIELCGVLKNVIAIAAGALDGLGFEVNSRSLLISRGLIEMIHLGNMLGGNTQAFLGLAGLGDLVATCSSNLSRNFTVGKRLAKGENISDILATMEEIPEGVYTVDILVKLLKNYKMRAPITETLHKILKDELTVDAGLRVLMKSPFSVDIDFL